MVQRLLPQKLNEKLPLGSAHCREKQTYIWHVDVASTHLLFRNVQGEESESKPESYIIIIIIIIIIVINLGCRNTASR
jgi:hypothetical protein